MTIKDINGSVRNYSSVDIDPGFPGYVKVEIVSKSDPARHHPEWYPTADFLAKNPELAKTLTPVKSPPDIVGVVTSATPKSLKDTTASFTKNAYAGFFVWISRGKGEGQKQIILKNSHNTLYINTPWNTKPDDTSQYVVIREIDKVTAAGNTLPIVEQRRLEEIARKQDIERGRIPAPRQYTDKEI